MQVTWLLQISFNVGPHILRVSMLRTGSLQNTSLLTKDGGAHLEFREVHTWTARICHLP